MNNINPPIFIVGAPRSGTTLLQYMLKSHPEISLPTGESHFFIPIYQRHAEFGDLKVKENLKFLLTEIYNARPDFFDDDFHGIKFDINILSDQLHALKTSTIPDVISTIFQMNATAEHKKYWGEKTPYYILHLPLIKEMFPNARIVHIIRDGRDCAISMLERRWDLRIYNIYHAAYTWNKYVRSGKDFGINNPDCYFEIKYTNLLNSPHKSLKALCKFLNIEYNESIINFERSNESGKTPLLTRPLQATNTQKWRNHMSIKELQIFEAMAGSTLTEYEYELSNPGASISKFNHLVYEAHIKLCDIYFNFFRN